MDQLVGRLIWIQDIVWVQVPLARPGCSSMGERLFGEQEAAGPIPVIPTHGFEGSRNSRYCSMRYTTEELTAALKDIV